MANNESSEPHSSMHEAAQDNHTMSTATMASKHDQDPSSSDPSPEVQPEVVMPRNTSFDAAQDEDHDPSAHQNLAEAPEDISNPDVRDLDSEGPARSTKEPPFGEKSAPLISAFHDFAQLSKFKEQVAGVLTSAEMYDLQVRKLQKLREIGDPAYTLSDQGKPKVLVRSLVDYLSTYEERMKSVEAKLGIALKPEKPAKGNTGPDIAETKFYDIDGPIRGSTDAAEDEWNIHGAFCSTVDTNHHIRALFRWKTRPSDDAADVQLPPDPKSVDILEIRIKSKSVAAFFQKELDYDISNEGLIHVVKPFRFLIRKVDLVRQHVNQTREKLRDVFKTTSPPEMAEDRGVDSLPATDPKSPTTMGSNEPSTDSSESELALMQLTELLSFIESYLQVDINLFQEYRKGARPSVTFNNLWMLFDTTDTIYCPLKKGENTIYDDDQEDRSFWTMDLEIPQVYRVLATSGGITRCPKEAQQKKSSRKFAHEADESISQHIREKWTSFYVDCCFIEFDGVRFRAVSDSFEFKPFQGELPITSLEAYPLLYHESSGEGDKKLLIQRGAHYADLTSVQHVSHKGLTLEDRKEDINSPVIVDFKSAYQHKPQWQPPLVAGHIIMWPFVHKSILEIPKRICPHSDCHKIACVEDVALTQQRTVLSKGFRDINIILDDYKVETKEQVEIFKEDMKSRGLLHLLPGAAYAFALRNRKWVKVDLKNLGIVKQEDNWNDLVLPSGHKEMVQAMVESFTSTGAATGDAGNRDDYDVDLVPGKGKGCIILLHGEPGVGKTSTAECVAAYTKRPLYPITCGDIGTTPAEVETALDNHFSRAHKWGCVLLLDEADVFLAKRNKSGDDIKRNGLVSVFLRTLEYYSGILFLTTNRVGSFDDAFRSRIHVQLYYPKLTEKQAVKIWKTNISRLQRHNEDRKNKNIPEVAIDKKRIVSFAKKNFEALHWNGRQIRNAFQTAVALAEFESRKGGGNRPELTKRHFQKVAKATDEFDEYLKELNQGADEEKIARRDQDRVVFTPRVEKLKPFATTEDASSSDSESSNSSEDGSSSGDSSGSESERAEKKKKKKNKKKEGEKKGKKPKKTKDSE